LVSKSWKQEARRLSYLGIEAEDVVKVQRTLQATLAVARGYQVLTGYLTRTDFGTTRTAIKKRAKYISTP
jgi:hypothetical protein